MKTTIIYSNPLSFFNPWVETCLSEPIDQFISPNIQVTNHTSTHYRWEFNLPEYSKKDLKIELINNLLTLSANKKQSSYFNRKLKSHSRFTTQIVITDDMDVEKINSKFKKGILKLEIPKKKESVSYREIPVLGKNSFERFNQASDNKKRWFDVLKEKVLTTFKPAV
ncbi:Hsp20/alpha crystallin family protein [Carboxylicivirga linearis]|uniref:Hsp20 family protein n=1 Tax=Carboxylicivirga linearis TaxID=1628157 RepID=A0ABS5JW44_9BACT|nr:Hsp20 family protein [Carboxylicivirga linearis]MBS2099117.1 Hsp20 family protein [Carboxylicivirga linearis]